MKTIPLKLLLLVCATRLLAVYLIPTNIYNQITDGVSIDGQPPTTSNQIPICDKADTIYWQDQGSFLNANSKIELKKYLLGYNFDDRLSRYTGRVGIYFSVLGDNVARVVLNSNYNNITAISVDTIDRGKNSSSREINIDDEYSQLQPIIIQTICTLDKALDLLLVVFNRNLSSDKEYKLDIEFNGVPSEGMNGIYRSQYQVPLSNIIKNSKNITKTPPTRIETIISTHFEPTYARQAFPCFDEPSMKARFSIYLTHPNSMKSFSNMPIESIMENDDNTVTVFFEETPPMSTYLVAFSVNNYSVISKVSDTINGVNVSVLLPSHMIHTGEFALDVATKALKLFESLTLIPYALNKLDLIGIPSFEAGAMENWGLITFRLTQMVFDNDTVSVKGKEYVAQTVIHEISHQWFGNYVTMKSWNDIWLNEGFATFMEIYATDRMFPLWNISVEESAFHIDSAIAFDELDITHPMAVPANFTEDIKTLFDAISYAKSGKVLSMLHEVIGDEIFWAVIKKYLNKYAFSSASSTDLWNILNEEIKTPNVNTMLHSWIFNVGLPVVTVAMVKKTNNESLISLSQRRNSENPEKWTIPISYEAKYDTNNTIYNGILWLTEPTQQFKMNGSIKMIKVNKERSGFYVTQYDNNFWDEIISLLETDKNELTASDKISLLSDSMRLSKNGMIAFDIPMKLLRILTNDMNYYIQLKCLGYLEAIGWLIKGDDQIYNNFKVSLFLNTVSAMCPEYNCSSVVNYLIGLYKEWKQTKIKIDPGLFTGVLKAVAINGNAEDIKSLENQYNLVDDPHLKRRFLFALAQVRNETLLEKYLNASIFENYVPVQEFGSFFSIASSNECGTNLTWNVVKKYWSQLKEKLVDSSFTLSSLIPAVTSNFKNETIIKELDDFYLANKNSIFHKHYKIAAENIKLNVDWSVRVLQNIQKNGMFGF